MGKNIKFTKYIDEKNRTKGKHKNLTDWEYRKPLVIVPYEYRKPSVAVVFKIGS